MSCNGCRVLRKGCSETCVLRTCLQWIETPEAQGNATLFLAKFFGRSDLLSFISAVPHHQRPSLFQSLLFEACGRTVNPVNGAVGLLSSGNWHVCQSAVETVLSGGSLRPMQGILAPPGRLDASSAAETRRSLTAYRRSCSSSVPSMITVDSVDLSLAAAATAAPRSGQIATPEILRRDQRRSAISSSEESVVSSGFGITDRKERKLLNLFV